MIGGFRGEGKRALNLGDTLKQSLCAAAGNRRPVRYSGHENIKHNEYQTQGKGIRMSNIAQKCMDRENTEMKIATYVDRAAGTLAAKRVF
jgi:CRISPR/Cas system-associated exonuclease Cas4 (RecB family)